MKKISIFLLLISTTAYTADRGDIKHAPTAKTRINKRRKKQQAVKPQSTTEPSVWSLFEEKDLQNLIQEQREFRRQWIREDEYAQQSFKLNERLFRGFGDYEQRMHQFQKSEEAAQERNKVRDALFTSQIASLKQKKSQSVGVCTYLCIKLFGCPRRQ